MDDVLAAHCFSGLAPPLFHISPTTEPPVAGNPRSRLRPKAVISLIFLEKIDLDSSTDQLVLCLPNGVNHRSAVS